MKKILALVLAVALCFAMTACGTNGTPLANEDGVYKIGIAQFVQHQALDAATKGFKDVLTEKLGDKVVFDEQNASGDNNICVNIVGKFANDPEMSLIMANATPAVVASANATTTIPILGTSVTDYGVAMNVKVNEGLLKLGNISGTSDLAPLDQQADMIVELVPTAKKVGLLYCSAEANSKFQVDEMAKYLNAKGIETKSFAFSDSNDLAAITTSACAYSDVIYIPTDNTAASSTGVIDGIARPAGVPIVAGEAGIAAGCGIAALSIDYYNLGRVTGEMAAKVLACETREEACKLIDTMPIEYDKAVAKKYNAEICAELGITIPEGYVVIE